MAKFITVLLSDMTKTYWKAVQWDTSIVSIKANKYYTAGVNLNIPKHPSDQIISNKIITETTTFSQATANLVQINKDTTENLMLANNKATKKQLLKLIK